MHVQHLYESSMRGRLLEVPYDELREANLVHWTPLKTFYEVVRDLAYEPVWFPNHQAFLDKHHFAGWLKKHGIDVI